MTDQGSDRALTAQAPAQAGVSEWRRRRWVVDAPYQLRAGVLVGAVAVVLLVLLNASLIFQYRAASASAAVRPPFVAHDRGSWALLLAGSAIFLIGVVLVSFLESHRTAGAAYSIRRAVDAIREGRQDVRIRLRRNDHLQELAASINSLAETIDAERRQRG